MHLNKCLCDIKKTSMWCSAYGSHQVSMMQVAEGWMKLNRGSYVNMVSNIGDVGKGIWFVL